MEGTILQFGSIKETHLGCRVLTRRKLRDIGGFKVEVEAITLECPDKDDDERSTEHGDA